MNIEVRQPDRSRTSTLEAFADTIVPGERRGPDDRAVAGVSSGGGAVASGALELMADPASGFADVLDTLAEGLNAHAEGYAEEQGLALDRTVPPFVSLAFEDRTALLQRLLAPEHPEREMWIGLALFSNMAFDSAAHLNTVEALNAGHPGLRAIGYLPPDADGLWRFERTSYGRQLAQPHPHTTETGSPA